MYNGTEENSVEQAGGQGYPADSAGNEHKGGGQMKRENKQNRKISYNLRELETAATVICQDFAAFCDYITEKQVKLSPRTGNIGKKDCFAINMLLHVREKYEKPVYLQSKYPIISLFYYTAVTCKILETNGAGNKLQQGRNYKRFHEASVWEQYALFLSVFMSDGMFACQDSFWYADRVGELWGVYVDRFMEWAAVEKAWTDGKSRKLQEGANRFWNCLDILAPCLEELALIRVCGKPAPENDLRERWWEIEMLPLLEIVSDIYENTELEEETEELSDSDRSTAAGYFYKAYVSRLLQGEEEKLSEIFENMVALDTKQTIDLEVLVRHTDCVRVIRMNLADSLYDLHDAIQRAVSFDNDHLFSFSD